MNINMSKIKGKKWSEVTEIEREELFNNKITFNSNNVTKVDDGNCIINFYNYGLGVRGTALHILYMADKIFVEIDPNEIIKSNYQFKVELYNIAQAKVKLLQKQTEFQQELSDYLLTETYYQMELKKTNENE